MLINVNHLIIVWIFGNSDAGQLTKFRRNENKMEKKIRLVILLQYFYKK